MRLDSLKINPENPRFIRDANFENLLKSVREFPEGLQVNPIVYDPETMFVLAGNMRLKALQELGYNEIPDNWTLSASMLNEEQKKRFIIVDNIGFGEWDYQMLNEDWNTDELKDWGLILPLKFEGNIDDFFEHSTDSTEAKEKRCPHCGGLLK